MHLGTKFSRTKYAVILLTLVLHFVQAQNPAAPNQKTAPPPAAREQVKKAIPAIGLILVRNQGDAQPKPRPRGSAVIISKDGLVITNFHVIARDRSTVLYDEIYLSLPADNGADAAVAPRQLRLQSVLTNQERDLALLRLMPEPNAKPEAPIATLPFLELGESTKIELLDDLFIIGFPEKGGTTVTVNYGVVEGRDALDDWIKTDARIIHGNSGGAAVNSAGKLIGIPTRVVADSDGIKTYGSVGYLRPAHLVAAMVSKYQDEERKALARKNSPPPVNSTTQTSPNSTGAKLPVTVRGTVISSEGKPLAGVRVGLLLVGQEVAAANIITWGGSNAEGKFELEKPVAPGRYNLRAKVVGYALYSTDIELSPNNPPLVIQLKQDSQD